MILKAIFILLSAGAVLAKYGHSGKSNHYDKYDGIIHPYDFGYNIKNKHGSQFRKESGDNYGTVIGSYGYTDGYGMYRTVKYIADHKNGFRAVVQSNEPGVAASANVNLVDRHGGDVDVGGYAGTGGYGRR